MLQDYSVGIMRWKVKIENLNLSLALFNQLKAHDIYELEELSRFTSEDIMRWHNLGRRSLEELIRIMKVCNIKFLE